MGRKTKQEKKVSELRRKLNSLEAIGLEEQKDTVVSKTKEEKASQKSGINYSYPANRTAEVPYVKTLNNQTSDYSYVFHDLQKIFLLTFLAVVIQFVLYFVINSQGVSFLSRFR